MSLCATITSEWYVVYYGINMQKMLRENISNYMRFSFHLTHARLCDYSIRVCLFISCLYRCINVHVPVKYFVV